MLKWKNREDGYITNMPAGISTMTPASQMTSHECSWLLNTPEEVIMLGCVGINKAPLTINKNNAYADG